jgi:hypothetical protein
METSNNDKPKLAMSVTEIFDDRTNKAIDSKRYQVRNRLMEIEANIRKSIEGHITYHKYLMQEAKNVGDMAQAMHHQVMMETYESVLKNYSMSNSYNNV